jgi:hypothetical protein
MRVIGPIRIDMRIDIQPDGYFHAHDDQTYDVDCDQDGFFSVSPTGSGETPWDAAEELLYEVQAWHERAESAEQAARLRKKSGTDAGPD